jgi:hypothetical protein
MPPPPAPLLIPPPYGDSEYCDKDELGRYGDARPEDGPAPGPGARRTGAGEGELWTGRRCLLIVSSGAASRARYIPAHGDWAALRVVCTMCRGLM